jgi:hypothetical protein
VTRAVITIGAVLALAVISLAIVLAAATLGTHTDQENPPS